MVAGKRDATLAPSTSQLGYIACAVGALSWFVWCQDSIWHWWLVSYPSRLFPPLFSLSFAAGWLAAFASGSKRQTTEEGAIRSQASIIGMVTAAVACATAYVSSKGGVGVASILAQQSHIALICFVLALLPSALFSNIGASLAGVTTKATGPRSFVTTAARGFFPLIAAAVWPVTYGVGKMLEKPVSVLSSPNTVVQQPGAALRYRKPDAFDTVHAWKLRIASEQVVPNVVEQSPFSLSTDRKRLAFLTRSGQGPMLTVRHFYNSDQDCSLSLQGGAKALSWSPDDNRLIGLNADGAFFVCEPRSGAVFALPIPKVSSAGDYGLAWWQPNEVLVFHAGSDPRLLSLDTLKLNPAEDATHWKALSPEEKLKLAVEAGAPPLRGTALASFVYLDLDSQGTRGLAAQDSSTIYAQLLRGEWTPGSGRPFSNGDGSAICVPERGQLRILYMGLRESPSLRFKAESESDFPMGEPVRAPLEHRRVRLAVVAPVVNPLNQRTVAGDANHLKGYVRVASASGKTCEVWVEQERQPIVAGDVLMDMTAIQEGHEYVVSHEWWAIITKATSDQSIPLQVEGPMLAPTPNRTLPVLPEPHAKQTMPTQQASAGTTPSGVMHDPPTLLPNLAKDLQLPSASGSTNANDRMVSTAAAERGAQLPAKAASPVETDEDKIRKFIKSHHEALTKRDIFGVLTTYGSVVRINGKDLTRAEINEIQSGIFNSTSHIIETVSSPIEIKRGQNNRFSASYTIAFEAKIPDSDDERGEGSIKMDVLMTSLGPKIVAKQLDVNRVVKVKKR